MTTEILLLGGRGQIGSGLRTYLPRLDTGYRFTSVDLPGAANRAEDLDDPGYFVDLDISAKDMEQLLSKNFPLRVNMEGLVPKL